ncbi:hypothetical protein FRB95_000776 [Tulasnella sp. JGI-2019a]|nr:hypothetical protein FRB95_000776 [Tulasnella sp. JGI-2019a]
MRLILSLATRSLFFPKHNPNAQLHFVMAGKRKLNAVVAVRGSVEAMPLPLTPKKKITAKRMKEDDDRDNNSLTSADEAMPDTQTPSAFIRRSSRTRRTAVAYVDMSDEDNEMPQETPSKAVEDWEANEESEHDDGSQGEPSSKHRKISQAKTPTKAKAKRLVTPRKKTKSDSAANGEVDDDTEPPTLAKKTRKREVKVEGPIIYNIPDVEKKETTFKGRLGYACLNTILRNAKPDPIFCSRTCRIATIKEKGIGFVKDLGLQNARDLLKMIEWNETNKIRFMRMSSEMFPFASHAEYGYDLSYAEKELKEAGDLAKKYGHRLTMHPGQFTQLGSPKDAVVESSIRELKYQCEIIDRMGLDHDSVMIIHGGGVYGDKEAALARFKENYTTKLPANVKARLVLENDELCYNLDDLMPMCEELEIPIIVDYHHDWIYPSSRPLTELIPIINKTWEKKGIKVKQHLSEPRPGAVTPMEKRAHADRCQTLPPGLPDDVDLMIEAKDKEQAVFELRRIYGLDEVIWENLRPPHKDQTLATGGRKSNKTKTNTRKKNLGNEEAGGEDVILEGEEKEGEETVAVE